MRRSARGVATLVSVLFAATSVVTFAPLASAGAIADTPSPGIIDGDAVTAEEAAAVTVPLAGTVARPARLHNSLAARGIEHTRQPARGVRR